MKAKDKNYLKPIGLSIIDTGAILYGCFLNDSIPKFLFGFLCLILGNIVGLFMIDFKGNN